MPEAERIRFRIGINLGDVIVEGDGDLYGDGVNVAARLEQLAEPGGVVVSGTAFDHLRGKLGRALRVPRRAAAQEHRAAGRAYRVVLGGGDRGPPERPRAAAARQALDRGAAVRQPERRPGAGLLRRRHRRGHHHRAVPHLAAVRHRPQLELRLQGQGGRRAAGRAASWACATCSRAACARAASGCASPRQLIDAATGAPPLGRALRRHARRTCSSSRTRSREAVVGAIEPTLAAGGDRARPAQADRKPRRLRPLPPGAAARLHAHGGGQPRGAAAARARPSRSTRATPRRSGSRPGATCRRTCAAGPATTRPSARPASTPRVGRSPSGRDDPTALAMGGFVVSLLAHDHEAGLAALGRAVALNPNSALALGSSALVHCFAGDYDDGDRARPAGAAAEPVRPAELQAADRAGLRPPLHRPPRGGGGVRRAGDPGEPRVRRLAHALLVASLVELGRLEEAREAAGQLMARVSDLPDRPAAPGGVPGRGAVRGVPGRAAPGRAAGLSPARRPSALPRGSGGRWPRHRNRRKMHASSEDTGGVGPPA